MADSWPYPSFLFNHVAPVFGYSEGQEHWIAFVRLQTFVLESVPCLLSMVIEYRCILLFVIIQYTRQDSQHIASYRIYSWKVKTDILNTKNRNRHLDTILNFLFLSWLEG